MKTKTLKTKKSILHGIPLGDDYMLTNGHWLASASLFSVDLLGVNQKIMKRERFTYDHGTIDECRLTEENILQVFPRDCNDDWQEIHATRFSQTIALQGYGRKCKLVESAIFKSEKNDFVTFLDKKYLDLLDVEKCRAFTKDEKSVVILVNHDGAFRALLMPVHCDAEELAKLGSICNKMFCR